MTQWQQAPAIVIERPRQAAIRTIPLASVDDETLVVQTTYSAIATGTEMKVWSGLTGALDGALWYPLVPGYEQVGSVVFVGDKVAGFQVGDRVMANEVRYYPDHCAAWGGQCALSIKNARTAPAPFDPPVKIPSNVSDQEAVLAYLCAVVKKGLDKVKPCAGETVLVIGLGMVGLAAAILTRHAGTRVIGLDINPKRLRLAAMFVPELIDPSAGDPLVALHALTEGRLADVIIECSGDAAVVGQLNKYLREGGWDGKDPGGRIHLQADYPHPITIPRYQNWFTKNMQVSMSCALSPGGKEAILALMADGALDLKPLLADSMIEEVPVDQAPEAYRRIGEARGDIFKVLLKW